MNHYDLILENGQYLTWIRGDVPPESVKTIPVAHVLNLSLLYRIPMLGLILRNFWAKRHGAILDPTLVAAKKSDRDH